MQDYSWGGEKHSTEGKGKRRSQEGPGRARPPQDPTMRPLAASPTTCAGVWGHSLSVNGIEMTTPLPVPTQSRFPAMSRAVMRTKEKPSLPVPGAGEEVEVSTTSGPSSPPH